MNPTKNYGNNAGAYPHLDNLEKEYEKESAMWTAVILLLRNVNINSCEHFYMLRVKYNTSTIAFYKIPFYKNYKVTEGSTIYFWYIYKKNKLIKRATKCSNLMRWQHLWRTIYWCLNWESCRVGFIFYLHMTIAAPLNWLDLIFVFRLRHCIAYFHFILSRLTPIFRRDFW